MKQSSFLNIIENSKTNTAICYHSLWGAGELQFLFDIEYLKVLKSFKNSREITGNDNLEIINDLKNVKFLVDDKVSKKTERNEYETYIDSRINELIYGKSISTLNLSISELCNFSCPHCSQAFITTPTEENKTKKIMKWEIAKLSLDYFLGLNDIPDELLDIHFGSEEPLLNSEVFIKSVEYIRDKHPKINISINTNLSLLNDKLAQFISDNNINVITSLDGQKETNNKMRPMKNGHSSFDLVLNNVSKLRTYDIPISGFITTILDLNFNKINKDFVSWLHENRFSTMSFDVDLVNTMGHNVNECIEKIFELKNAANDLGMQVTGVWRSPFELLANGSIDKISAYCKATKGHSISVSPSGDIYSCSGSSLRFGSIFDDPEKTFDKDSIYFRNIKSRLIRTGTFCEDCPLETVCGGQCLMTNDFSDVQKDTPPRAQELCTLYKECTVELLQEKLLIEMNQ